MGQQEVYDFLKKHPAKWFSSREISKAIGISIGSVTCSLQKMRKGNLVRYRVKDKDINYGKRKIFQYRYKR